MHYIYIHIYIYGCFIVTLQTVKNVCRHQSLYTVSMHEPIVTSYIRDKRLYMFGNTFLAERWQIRISANAVSPFYSYLQSDRYNIIISTTVQLNVAKHSSVGSK